MECHEAAGIVIHCCLQLGDGVAPISRAPEAQIMSSFVSHAWSLWETELGSRPGRAVGKRDLGPSLSLEEEGESPTVWPLVRGQPLGGLGADVGLSCHPALPPKQNQGLGRSYQSPLRSQEAPWVGAGCQPLREVGTPQGPSEQTPVVSCEDSLALCSWPHSPGWRPLCVELSVVCEDSPVLRPWPPQPWLASHVRGAACCV